MDAVEADGIACAGGMAADNPMCTEQFKNSDVAALKVSPEAGYAFTGWTVNGAQITTASAETLFLTTMPMLAQNSDWVTPFTGNTAACQANCSKVTISTPATVKRDEIFDVTLMLNPPPQWTGTTVTFDLIGQKTQNLPERGAVQMYDFGYDRDGDGDIDPGQTSYTFNPLIDNGTKTIKAVYNLYQPPQTIKIAVSLGGYTFESQPIAVTYQMRQYTTINGDDNVNDYDPEIIQWVNYWTHWHYPDETNPYTFKTKDFTYDFIKAICYKESSMLNAVYLASCSSGDEHNIMQCKQSCRDGLSNGSKRDWNWKISPIGTDTVKGDLYLVPPKMLYTDVGVQTSSERASDGEYVGFMKNVQPMITMIQLIEHTTLNGMIGRQH